MTVSKTKTSFYRRLYVAWLIDSGTACSVPALMAATGITVATGGLGACLLGAVVGVIVGLAMSKTGADKGLTKMCDWIGNALFPPSVQATILSGSTDTLTNNIPAARAASG